MDISKFNDLQLLEKAFAEGKLYQILADYKKEFQEFNKSLGVNFSTQVISKIVDDLVDRHFPLYKRLVEDEKFINKQFPQHKALIAKAVVNHYDYLDRVIRDGKSFIYDQNGSNHLHILNQLPKPLNNSNQEFYKSFTLGDVRYNFDENGRLRTKTGIDADGVFGLPQVIDSQDEGLKIFKDLNADPEFKKKNLTSILEYYYEVELIKGDIVMDEFYYELHNEAYNGGMLEKITISNVLYDSDREKYNDKEFIGDKGVLIYENGRIVIVRNVDELVSLGRLETLAIGRDGEISVFYDKKYQELYEMKGDGQLRLVPDEQRSLLINSTIGQNWLGPMNISILKLGAQNVNYEPYLELLKTDKVGQDFNVKIFDLISASYDVQTGVSIEQYTSDFLNKYPDLVEKMDAEIINQLNEKQSMNEYLNGRRIILVDGKPCIEYFSGAKDYSAFRVAGLLINNVKVINSFSASEYEALATALKTDLLKEKDSILKLSTEDTHEKERNNLRVGQIDKLLNNMSVSKEVQIKMLNGIDVSVTSSVELPLVEQIVAERTQAPVFTFADGDNNVLLQLISNNELIRAVLGEESFDRIFDDAVQKEVENYSHLNPVLVSQMRNDWNSKLVNQEMLPGLPQTKILEQLTSNSSLLETVLTEKQFEKLFSEALENEKIALGLNGTKAEARKNEWAVKLEANRSSEFLRPGRSSVKLKETRLMYRLLAARKVIEFVIGKEKFNKIFNKAALKEAKAKGLSGLDAKFSVDNWKSFLAQKRTVKIKGKEGFLEQNKITPEAIKQMASSKNWSKLQLIVIDQKEFLGKMIVQQDLQGGGSRLSIVEKKMLYDRLSDPIASKVKDTNLLDRLEKGEPIALAVGENKEIRIYQKDNELNAVVEIPRSNFLIPNKIHDNVLKVTEINTLLQGEAITVPFKGEQFVLSYRSDINKMVEGDHKFENNVRSLLEKKDFKAIDELIVDRKSKMLNVNFTNDFLKLSVISNAKLSVEEKNLFLKSIGKKDDQISDLYKTKDKIDDPEAHKKDDKKEDKKDELKFGELKSSLNKVVETGKSYLTSN